MSVQTDLAVIGPAAAEAAAALADALGLGAIPGDNFDFWPPGEARQANGLSDILSEGTKAWSAPLIGPLGPCGEIALVLAAGANVPGEGRVASALAGSVHPLTGACGADHVGEMQRADPDKLAEERPGHHAAAVALMSGEERVGVLVVITSTSQVAELPHLDGSPGTGGAPRSIAALADVEMTVSVELGRTKIPVRDLLNIHNGAVVQLDRAVSHPVDIFVHGTLIARGEVVVVDECFAVRVTELLTGD
ncbi:MAG: flagellar motor switch protein FliN [Acidimicrobiales bacterium]